MTSAHHDTDFKAALTGFVIGAIALFLLLSTIVHLTNAKYNRDTPPAAAAHQ